MTKETDTLTGIDAEKGRIKIKKEDTTNCENGCELYVNLKTNEVFNKDYTENPLIFSYSISYSNANEMISIKIEENVKGYIEESNTMKYYKVTIPKDKHLMDDEIKSTIIYY